MAVRALLRLRDEVKDSITIIAYHKEDAFEHSDAKTRFNYYPNVTGLPEHLVINGNYLGRVGYDEVRNAFNEQKNLPDEIELSHSTNYSTNTGEGETTIYIKNISKNAIEGTCQIALCQRDSAEQWGGTNGEDTLFAILWKMLPDGEGTTVRIDPDSTYYITQPFTVQESWQRDDCYLTAFIQKSDKQIIQSIEINLEDMTFVKKFDKNIQQHNLVSIKHNPQKRYLLINLNNKYDNAKLKIFNCAGIVKKQVNIHKQNLKIPLNDFSSGTYFCIVEIGDNIERFKFIKF